MSTTTFFDVKPAAAQAVPAALTAWLYTVAALIFIMILVGGATRLTDSGLSITEWQPLLGAIPPLSEADWQLAFAKYKQIPEYQLVNRGMSLEEFKVIYWWEWGHRFLGRIIGLVFFIPLVWFWLRGQIAPSLKPWLLLLLLLGGLQGALGWYMVKSGLVDRVDVSQYRLAAHLGLAMFIFAMTLWIALGTRQNPAWAAPPSAKAARPYLYSAAALTGLIYAQIILGAFVAGLDAGRAHNTWPLMDGEFIPSTVGELTPWYRDLFENVSTVQFSHRMLAYAVAGFAAVHTVFIWRSEAAKHLRLFALLVLGAVMAQAILGIWTVIAAVPLSLGLAHQAGAVVLLALAIIHLRQAGERTVAAIPHQTPARA